MSSSRPLTTTACSCTRAGTTSTVAIARPRTSGPAIPTAAIRGRRTATTRVPTAASREPPGEGNTFRKRVFAEWGIRAVPESQRYVATAGPHHGQPYGSLVLIDLCQVDDDGMSQVTRITPDARFPESEVGTYDSGRPSYKYGTPWPLSESYYLCNYEENLYLVDKFGNRELLCSLGESLREGQALAPAQSRFPSGPRREPPTIPAEHTRATGPAIRTTRRPSSVCRTFTAPICPCPRTPGSSGCGSSRSCESRSPPCFATGRRSASARSKWPHVPGPCRLRPDGSAYFEAPVGVPIYFQALDHRSMAVQSMRSDTYVHPGEQLTCAGCHESKWEACPAWDRPAVALDRPPSKIEPEVGGVEPVSYHRLVEPVFQRTCVACHSKEGKGPANLD